MIVDCNIFHVMALGEQSVNFTKIGNFNNLGFPGGHPMILCVSYPVDV